MPIKTAFGLYKSPDNLQTAVDRLKSGGAPESAITALFPENSQSRAFAAGQHTAVPEGTASGPTADRELQGSTGLTTPFTGPKEGAMPHAFRVMGISDEDADTYAHKLKDGMILLSVRSDEAGGEANVLEILRATGAEEIDTGVVADPMSGRPER